MNGNGIVLVKQRAWTDAGSVAGHGIKGKRKREGRKKKERRKKQKKERKREKEGKKGRGNV